MVFWRGCYLGTQFEPYGPPYPETLERFEALCTGAKILDFAGGYGRYAIPLAQAGYNVTLVDVDAVNLADAARRRNEAGLLPNKLQLIAAEAVRPRQPPPLQLASYDGLLSAGLLFLPTPGEARQIFGLAIQYLKPGGLVVVEFMTDRQDQGTRPLVGSTEANWRRAEGQVFLLSLFKSYGLTNFKLTEREHQVHLSPRHIMTANLLIASAHLAA